STAITTTAIRYRNVDLLFLPKKLEIGIKFGDGAGILSKRIDLLLKFCNSNEISLSKTFSQIGPDINGVFKENERLSNGIGNGVQDP
ncbi:hypothetical protein A2U01_0064600, partial [Trifolium medium]|nr:hypothetical protein [Trifolium medium]